MLGTQAFWWGKQGIKIRLGRPRRGWEDNIKKWISKKSDGRARNGLVWLGMKTVNQHQRR